MAGFYIYYGNSIPEQRILNAVNGYYQEDNREYDGQAFTLLETVNNFAVRDNDSICFDFSFDERIPYRYRDETLYRIQTYKANIRLIRMNGVIFYLIENVKVAPHKFTNRISRIVYGNEDHIQLAPINSEIIERIERNDYSVLHGEALKNVSDRDNTVMVYGNLAQKNEDGEEEYSVTHQRYLDNEKGYVHYTSTSVGHQVRVSEKKGTLSLTGRKDLEATLDDVEIYIRNFLLPEIDIM